MRLNRAYEITYLLMERGQMTCRELAEALEVSAKTVRRDIDALCEAGVPLYARKGRGGGYALEEGYVLNKTLLTKAEQGELLSALQGMRAATGNEGALRKLAGLFGGEKQPWIDVDFSGWSGESRERFEAIKQGILECRALRFFYSSRGGETSMREVEPLQLCFKERHWYLRAFCRLRQEERTFKLTRMEQVCLLEETFAPRSMQERRGIEMASPRSSCTPIRIHMDESLGYRVLDEFDRSEYERNEDGSYTVEFAYPLDEWVYGFLLSFGAGAKVLSPDFVKEEIVRRLKKNLRRYL